MTPNPSDICIETFIKNINTADAATKAGDAYMKAKEAYEEAGNLLREVLKEKAPPGHWEIYEKAEDAVLKG